MALTLNQIVKRLRSLALSHKQIKFFYQGDPWEFDLNGEITYAACFLEFQPGVIDRTEHKKSWNFRVYFLDLVTVSTDTEGNELEVISDMDGVATDFLAMVMSANFQDDWIITPLNNFTSVTEVLGDMAAGVFLDISIGVDFLADNCQVPAEETDFENDFDMARTKIFRYEGTGSEGSSFTPVDVSIGGTLAGKTVLAVYKAGIYKRAITTTPVDSEKIKIEGTDLGGYKGIESSTWVVTFQAGDGLLAGELLDFIIWST